MRHLAPSSIVVLLLAGCEIDGGLTKHNAEPTATIVDPLDGAAILEGTTVSLAGVVGDGDSEAIDLDVSWRISGASACPEAAPDAAGNTWCDFVMTDANADITLTVVDPSGGTANDSITLLATPDQSPTVSIESPTADGHYYSDQLVTFRGTVGDVEDAPESLAVRWVSSLTGELALGPVPTSAGVVESFGNLSEGEQALQLFVVDSNGNESSASVIVDVGPPNSAPSCGITNPLDGAAGAEGSTVSFEGLVEDVDVAPSWLAVTWESDKDGVLGTSTPDSDGTVVFGWSGLSSGPHAVTLRAIDDLGAECTTSIQYTVGTPPDISIDSPAPSEVVNEGASLSFAALVSDVEDPSDNLSVAWESDLDGVLHTAYADSSGVAAFSESALSRGEHTLTATVTDTSGLSSRATTTFIVNGLPTAPSVSISPASPVTDDALVVSIDSPAVDPEGDPLSYLYQWTRDGVADSTGTTIGAASTTRGETWEVSVWAYDGYGDGLVGTASVVIGNSAPSLSSVDITPDPASRNDTLTCTASGYVDADGDADSSAYAWTINGTAAGTGATLAGPFTVGDVVTCTVTPFDGTDAGTPVSDSITISNGAPVVTSLALSPTDVYTNDTVTASVSATDPDGEALTTTYAWTINSVAAASTSNTLDGSLAGSFDRDDVVEVTVSVSDGVDTTTSTASVTIQNTPPTAPTLAFDPSLPEEAEALQCAIDVASTDDDGDTVSYSFTWLQDASAFTALDTTDYTDDTVPAGTTVAGETWTCTVVPDDGTDNGPSSAISTTIDGGSCTSLTAAWVTGWGSTYTSGSLDWVSMMARQASYGSCTVSIVGVGRGWTAASLVATGAEVVIVGDPAGGTVQYTAAEIAAIQSYTSAGSGGIVVTFLLGYNSYDERVLANLVGINSTYVTTAQDTLSSNSTIVLDTTHPLASGLPGTFTLTQYAYEQELTTSWAGALLSGGSVVMANSSSENVVIAYEGAAWNGVWFSSMPEYSTTSADRERALYNALVWGAGYTP